MMLKIAMMLKITVILMSRKTGRNKKPRGRLREYSDDPDGTKWYPDGRNP